MTWSEFVALDDPDNAKHYELHDGEAVLAPLPSPRHFEIQERLCDLLRSSLGVGFRVAKEFPYRPLAEMQYWVADVAAVRSEAWRRISEANSWIPQTPELIAEILSPSNLRGKIERQRMLALSTGAEQFWVINAKAEQVLVTTRDGVTAVFVHGDTLPVGIEVSAIFEH